MCQDVCASQWLNEVISDRLFQPVPDSSHIAQEAKLSLG